VPTRPRLEVILQRFIGDLKEKRVGGSKKYWEEAQNGIVGGSKKYWEEAQNGRIGGSKIYWEEAQKGV